MRQLPCPHCHETPWSLDTHIRFDCPKLKGRSRYVDPITKALPEFFAEIEDFLVKTS